MTADLIIFDCDGVLVDSEPVTLGLLAEEMTAHGLPMKPDEVTSLFVGGTIAGAAQTAISRGATLPDGWVEGFYDRMFAELRKGVPLIPGVVDLLDRLDDAGIAVAVASNGPMAKMEITLAPHGLWDRLHGRIYSGHDYGPKPAPDMLLHAMEQAGASPARTVMIDDTAAGWRAAQAAGVRGLAYVPEAHGTSSFDGATPFARMEEVDQLIALGPQTTMVPA